MQIKNVIKENLKSIMFDIMDNNRKIRYNIALPTYDTNNNNNNNHNDENEQAIPMSQIAKQLRDKMILWKNNQEDDTEQLNQSAAARITSKSNLAITSASNLKLDVEPVPSVSTQDNDEIEIIETQTSLGTQTSNEIKNIELDLGIIHRASINRVKSGTATATVTASTSNIVSPSPSGINSPRSGIGMNSNSSGAGGGGGIMSRIVSSDSMIGNRDYSRKADIISMNISKYIIVAFKQLYFKYIGEMAVYMINISSRTRERLTHALDPKYFYENKPIQEDDREGDNNNNNNNNNNNTSPSNELTKQKTFDYFANITNRVMSTKIYSPRTNRTTRFSIGGLGSIGGRRRGSSRTRRQSIANPNNKTMIEHELAQFVKKQSSKGMILTEKMLYEWVLLRLMVTMEDAIREVSRVMSDSYSRFKGTNVFEKVLKLTEDATA